jgi:hypothetical protein
MRKDEYISITREMAKANPDYWQVIQHMFQEQAVRILQRGYRKKWNKPFTGKYEETIDGSLSLSFLKEPRSEAKAVAYAQCIKQKKYTDLDFSDPDFIRNMCKALRLAWITSDQYGTAVALYCAAEEYKEENKVTRILTHCQNRFFQNPLQLKSTTEPRTLDDLSNNTVSI